MSKYTYDDVFEASLEYFDGDSLGASVFAGKYAVSYTHLRAHET